MAITFSRIDWTNYGRGYMSKQNNPQQETRRDSDVAVAHPPSTREVRSVALTLLLVIAGFYTVYFSRAILIPIVLAILASVMLSPVVNWISGFRVPKSVASGLVLALILGAFSYILYAAGQPVSEWIAELPAWIKEAEYKIRDVQGSVQKLSEATESVEELADQVMEGRERVPNVVIKRASLTSFLLGWTHQMLVGLGMTCILVYFLLTNGDTFLRKLVQIIPKFKDKKQAVEIVRQIEGEVSRYVLTISLCNAVLGGAISMAMWLWGVPNPLIIGLMAAITNFVPYIGPLVGAGVVCVIAFVEFGTLINAGLIATTYLAITAVEGTLITPMVLGKSFAMNPVVLLVGLMVLTSIWGVPGAILAVPILVALKIVFDRIERLSPIGEFMGK